mmetsp:Transcript_73893/g.196823  ORF Transcript_73893/g.196823 Transcript_73893/m.196823 type:complete len:202 (-) Transcript_73893:164-769(-)
MVQPGVPVVVAGPAGQPVAVGYRRRGGRGPRAPPHAGPARAVGQEVRARRPRHLQREALRRVGTKRPGPFPVSPSHKEWWDGSSGGFEARGGGGRLAGEGLPKGRGKQCGCDGGGGGGAVGGGCGGRGRRRGGGGEGRGGGRGGGGGGHDQRGSGISQIFNWDRFRRPQCRWLLRDGHGEGRGETKTNSPKQMATRKEGAD